MRLPEETNASTGETVGRLEIKKPDQAISHNLHVSSERACNLLPT